MCKQDDRGVRKKRAGRSVSAWWRIGGEEWGLSERVVVREVRTARLERNEDIEE